MDWQGEVKRRYEEAGWEALRPADQNFRQRLQQFCTSQGISIIDDNPEGEDWVMLLNNGTELYVDYRSYDTGNEKTDFWIQYEPDCGGIVAEFSFSNAKDKRYEIIVANEEIAAVWNDW